MVRKDNHATRPWVCNIRGHGVRYHRRFTSRRKAKAFEATILATRGQPGALGTGGPTGAQTFEQFVTEVIAAQEALALDGHARLGTVVGWKSKLAQIPRWFRRKQLHRMSEQDCFHYLQWLRNKQRRTPDGSAQHED